MRNSAGEALAVTPRRGGRRIGSSGTRGLVLAAAQRQFAELGYDRTSMRSVAAEAGVDQKLVGYFFKSKQALFVTATALPFDNGAAMPQVLEGDVAGRGRRLARLIVEMLEHPETGPRLVGLVRAAAAEPEAARMVRELFSREIWEPAAARLDVQDPDVAVGLIATQILGLVMSRYVIRAEALASMSAEAIIELITPNLQRLLSAKPTTRRIK